jgi:xanthine dehydrogenase accessory factor
MSTKSIIDAFEQWKADGQPLIMVTVYATEGSTYSKTGHRILIAANGDYQGLVSGGCLEGDLAEHARAVLDTGTAQAVTYDLRDEADEIWGMGIGCNGVIKVLLQRLSADSRYEPFQTIAERHLHQKSTVCATIVTSRIPELPVGATLIDWQTDYSTSQIPEALRDPIQKQCAARISVGLPELVEQELPTGHCTILYAPIISIPRLLVLGAGPDAVPLVNMAVEIGWRVTVADHRAAYLEEPAFRDAHEIICIEPKQLEKTKKLNDFSAAVVMSHHLETDRSYLRQLASSKIAYIGVLGPRARRDRLISELDTGEQQLGERLKGPVGLEIGADSPESIALSILAEIHQTISNADN